MTKKRMLLITAIGLLLACLLVWLANKVLHHYRTRPIPSAEQLTKAGKEPWITIFVHGTFCSPFGLFNFFETIQDDVLGTHYQQLNKFVRADPYFYQEQPIQDRGLVYVEPSFDMKVTEGKTLAVYPLLKAYESIMEQVRPGQEYPFFYTFGWSGLLSQKVRRFEAIRLYNMLSKELNRYADQGMRPKIRIIAHSHGGNVVLNLALIHELLLRGIEHKVIVNTASQLAQHRSHALEDMRQIMTKLPSQESAAQKSGMKKWDYLPINKNLTIDELIIYGCPLQPETDHCAVSHTFKKIYNFYSGEDIIQKMDWISTKRYYSEQRFSPEYVTSLEREHYNTRLVQAKLMLRKSLFTSKQEQPTFFSGLWKYVSQMVGFFVRQTNDPTHRELWYIGWDDPVSSSSLAPLPMFVFTPFLVHAIETNVKSIDDVDLNLTLHDAFLSVDIFAHDKPEIEYTVRMPIGIVNQLKEHVLAWKPSQYSADKKFELINGYSAKIR